MVLGNIGKYLERYANLEGTADTGECCLRRRISIISKQNRRMMSTSIREAKDGFHKSKSS